MNVRTLARTKTFTIILHILVWTGLFLLPYTDEDRRHITDYFLYRNGFFILLIASIYYINYYSLIPKLLLQNRPGLYYLSAFLLLITVCFLNLGFANIMDIVFDHFKNRPSYWRRLTFPVFPALFMFAISSAIRLTSEWFRNEKEKKEMENEKLSSELAFLKSQVNPHFLFNILNNICSLARKKSDNTENAIIKLSQIMRYMLFDSKDEKVSLEKELDYLKNYIELQQMRISDAVKVNLEIEGDTEGKMIEPMLLIPFVENAFKHGVTYLERSDINISVAVTERNLTFSVSNYVSRHTESRGEESGIGLKNVNRRLELLYPERHDLQIEEKDEQYHVKLKIIL